MKHRRSRRLKEGQKTRSLNNHERRIQRNNFLKRSFLIRMNEIKKTMFFICYAFIKNIYKNKFSHFTTTTLFDKIMNIKEKEVKNVL